MRIAILSGGASLDTYQADGSFDWIIAVNVAATVHRADWWSCGDSDTFTRLSGRVLGCPALWTCDETLRRLAKSPGVPLVSRAYARESLFAQGKRWPMFSVTAALALAIDLIGQRPGQIIGFGLYQHGGGPLGGQAHCSSIRSPERFALECDIWHELARSQPNITVTVTEEQP